MKVETATFTRLLDNARQWDSRYNELRNAQTCWMLRHFSFADSFCVFINPPDNVNKEAALRLQRELDRKRWQRLDAVLKSLRNIGRLGLSVLPGEESIKKCLLYGALLFALLSPATATQAFAQDDFPPPGIFIPCCSSGGTGGHTGATYGENGQSAWKQVWGAGPGDIVTFQFVLRARSAGSLHAWPQTTGGTDMQYLGNPDNPYEKWYWNTGQRSSGGTFCIDCPWQFTSNAYNPWIYIDYWDSGDGWDVDLNVTNIRTPTPAPSRQIYSAAEKDNARWWRDTTGGAANFIGGFAGGYCIAYQDRFCAAASLAYFIASVIQNHFGTIVQDPDDPWYQYPADPDHRGYDPAQFGWGWAGDYWTDQLILSAMVIGPYSWTADVTINRASTCIKYNDDCQWWQQQRLQSMHYVNGDWLRYGAQVLGILRDEAWREGHYDAYDSFNYAVNVIWGAGDYSRYLANQGY